MVEFNNFYEIKIDNDVERILILRKRLNLSQYQLAKAIGVSTSYLGQIERGDIVFPPQLILKINEFLKRERDMYEKNISRDS